jgi:hypothetical protein
VAHTSRRAPGRRALERVPGYPDAQFSLAAVELGERQPGAAEARLRGRLAQAEFSAEQCGLASGLLADALDAQSYTSEALVAYTETNELRREANAPRFATTSPSVLRYVLRLADHLRSADQTRWRTAPPSSGPGRRWQELKRRSEPHIWWLAGDALSAARGSQCWPPRVAQQLCPLVPHPGAAVAPESAWRCCSRICRITRTWCGVKHRM